MMGMILGRGIRNIGNNRINDNSDAYSNVDCDSFLLPDSRFASKLDDE